MTDEEAAKHSPVVRERDGVLTQYWRVRLRVRCREVEASGGPASGPSRKASSSSGPPRNSIPRMGSVLHADTGSVLDAY